MFLSKYAVARHIYIPVIKRAVVDFAVGADWTPAAGDVKVSIDGGAAANVTNLPVAVAMGNGATWDFSLTGAEITGKQIVVTVADAATKAVEDQSFVIETYGNASAQHAFDLGTVSTAQTGDAYASLTAVQAEPGQGNPAVNASVAAKISYLYKAWRNKVTQTSSTYSLFADDASTVDQKAAVSDDGTTFTRGEIATGP